MNFYVKAVCIVCFILQTFCINSYSQKKTVAFKIGFSGNRVSNSLYGSMLFLDSRADSSSFGTVFLDHGFGDRKRTVVASPSLSIQLPALLDSLIDSTALKTGMLFQLCKLLFMPTGSGTSSKRYCFVRAYLYSQKGDFLQKIASIDTAIVTKGNNGTRSLLSESNLAIQKFVASNLIKMPIDTELYKFSDIRNIDSLEKAKLLVYNISEFIDGSYLTYKSFAFQIPDGKIVAKLDGDKISHVKRIDSAGNTSTLKERDIYAIVYDGQPFISTQYGFYKLEKVNGDFIFVGKAKASANSADVMAATLAFGIIGGILASNVTGTFEMKIDHVNGRSIIVQQLKDQPE